MICKGCKTKFHYGYCDSSCDGNCKACGGSNICKESGYCSVECWHGSEAYQKGKMVFNNIQNSLPDDKKALLKDLIKFIEENGELGYASLVVWAF